MRRMLVNVAEPEEGRIAIVENDLLQELYVERTAEEKFLGNVYKGRVVSVEPSLAAAFVDFGRNCNGFLHVSDVMPAYGRRSASKGDGPRRDITDVLQNGQEVLVQITKDQIGTKVPTLTTYISLPGRYLVLMPSVSKCGVSKKIRDETERRKLKAMIEALDPPAGMGYIVRTAGVDRSAEELARDLSYLLKLWKAIQVRVRSHESPATIYKESDLVIRTIRDIVGDDLGELIIDDFDVYKRAIEFLDVVMPDFVERVKFYPGPKPIFHEFHIEQQIDQIQSKRVPLKTGGSLVIEQTEALVAIDVNSGRFRENTNVEDTAYQTNLEAAAEIARQLRLRDLGGLIVCDFIDMMEAKHRSSLERAFQDHLRHDRARVRTARISRFSLIELTRQRVRESLKRTTYAACSHCSATGYVKTVESVALETMRGIRLRLADQPSKGLDVVVHPEVAGFLQRKKRQTLNKLEARFGVKISVKGSREHNLDEVRFQ